MSSDSDYFSIVFEGSPGPGENPRFIDVINSKGESIPPGEWVKVEDPKYPGWDLWEMRFYIRREDGKTILEPPASQELAVAIEVIDDGDEAEAARADATEDDGEEPSYAPRIRPSIH